MLLLDLILGEAPVNWKMFLVNSNRCSGRCKFWLFLVE